MRASFAPTASWWWKRHTPPGFEPPGGRLADVMQHGRPAEHQVRTFGLQTNGLVEHLQGMGVDVLVLAVLVGRHAQGGKFRQDDVGQARVDEDLQAAPRGPAPAAAW